MGTRETLSFLRSWLSDPTAVGAIAPSGQALAQAITAEISAASAPVIELGPGTGVFTRALLARGLRERDLTLVEYGSDFVRLLQHSFPSAQVLWMDAGRLSRETLGDGVKAGAVVSGLPLLNLSPRKVVAILAGAFAVLRPNGVFYQFTYAPVCPASRPLLDRLGLKASLMARVIRNVPPASVYRITRRGPLRLVSG
jgi:phospholipid N-methyltransferase